MKAQAGSVGGGKSRTYRYQKPEVAKKTAAKGTYKLRKQSNSDTRRAKKK